MATNLGLYYGAPSGSANGVGRTYVELPAVLQECIRRKGYDPAALQMGGERGLATLATLQRQCDAERAALPPVGVRPVTAPPPVLKRAAPAPCAGCTKAAAGGLTAAPAQATPVLKREAPAGGATGAAATAGMVAAPATAILTRTADSVPAGRTPQDFLAFIEENGGTMLWVILALIILAMWRGSGRRSLW